MYEWVSQPSSEKLPLAVDGDQHRQHVLELDSEWDWEVLEHLVLNECLSNAFPHSSRISSWWGLVSLSIVFSFPFWRGRSLFHLISYSTLWMVVRTGNQTWTWRQALKKRSWRNRITILCRLISYSSCSGMALAIVNHQSRKYSMIFCLLDNLMETFSQLKFPFSVWLLLDYIW